jgi:uncharacterized protein YjiS (DUF1127 family)
MDHAALEGGGTSSISLLARPDHRPWLVVRRTIMSIIRWLTSRKGAAASSHHADAKTCRPGWKTRFVRWCAKCSARSRQRQALAELDDDHLKDIGVTRQQAIEEASKPFWK